MRIITGLAKGMPLVAPRSGVRPTSDRARSAIFSILGDHVVGARVLDLFAGTGALGLEAASRGAAAVTFVENAREALKCLESNVAEFIKRLQGGCEPRWATRPTKETAATALQVAPSDVPAVLRRMVAEGHRFSLVFADPPYGEIAQELLRDPRLPRLVEDDGLFVLESAKHEALPVGAPWQLVREATYGDTRVSFLRHGASPGRG